MIIRKLERSDCNIILDWMKDEQEFYIITGGTLGSYPLTPEMLFEAYSKQSDELITFIAEDEKLGPVGHFALRDKGNGNRRLCYVVINKDHRGNGLGEAMVREAIRYSFDRLNASKVSLAVFKVNEPALNCYKKLGFEKDGPDSIFDFMDRKEECYEMALYQNT